MDKEKNEKAKNEERPDLLKEELPNEEVHKGEDDNASKKKKFTFTGKDPLKKKNEDLQKKIDEINDKYLRLYSEFDNYRKRTQKERLDLLKTASADTVVSMLTVLDDFERAIKAGEDSEDLNAIREGNKLIYNKFKNILTLKGLEEIKAMGEVFDTDFHEAITNVPVDDDTMKGKVMDVTEKGYLLNGKVIRFAKVVVGN